MPADSEMLDDAGQLIASMLAAGLDRNAMRWASLAEPGSDAWALLVVGSASQPNPISESAISDFHGNDSSENNRRTAFLIAGLAGLDRIPVETARDLASTYDFNLDRQTRWSQLIRKAAEVDNQGLVALLAGVGMQGASWEKMTPRHLYNIVAALRQVGLEAEARMIAAESVARG